MCYACVESMVRDDRAKAGSGLASDMFSLGETHTVTFY
jgi:hypothetical protein